MWQGGMQMRQEWRQRQLPMLCARNAGCQHRESSKPTLRRHLAVQSRKDRRRLCKALPARLVCVCHQRTTPGACPTHPRCSALLAPTTPPPQPAAAAAPAAVPSPAPGPRRPALLPPPRHPVLTPPAPRHRPRPSAPGRGGGGRPGVRFRWWSGGQVVVVVVRWWHKVHAGNTV